MKYLLPRITVGRIAGTSW